MLPNVSKIYERCLYNQITGLTLMKFYLNINEDFAKSLMHNTA